MGDTILLIYKREVKETLNGPGSGFAHGPREPCGLEDLTPIPHPTLQKRHNPLVRRELCSMGGFSEFWFPISPWR
jgi:hypothetical protein